jgi:hypothetical protein
VNIPRGLLKSDGDVITTTRRDICGGTCSEEIWEFIVLGVNLPNQGRTASCILKETKRNKKRAK